MKKQDFVLEYIRSIEHGAKVSIRGIAGALSVSDGTAYKAIKQARALGLVDTRPRSGTFRTLRRDGDAEAALTLRDITRQLGLSVLTAGEDDARIAAILVGDGSARRLCGEVLAAGGVCLCLVGDRPELQEAALGAGAHLLVTGGADVAPGLRAMASAARRCILLSPQGSAGLLRQLYDLQYGKARPPLAGRVGDWMRAPQYLYHNDVASDWYNAYHPLGCLNAQYAVVDDDLTICGSLDAVSALSCPPTEKIANLYRRGAENGCCTVSEDASVEALAALMLARGSEIAFVTRDGALVGTVTCHDILRFYQHAAAGDAGVPPSPALELIDQDRSGGRSVYTARLPDPEAGAHAPDHRLLLLLEAARRHIRSLPDTGRCHLEYGSYSAMDDSSFGRDVMVESRVSKRSGPFCTLDVEMYDDVLCYARGTLTFSAEKFSSPEGGEH